METSKGHMNQTRKNITSTNPQDPKQQDKAQVEPLEQHTNAVLANIIYPQ